MSRKIRNLEKIRADIQKAYKTFRRDNYVELDYDERAVAWLDDYIERHRIGANRTAMQGQSNVIGAFFGECIRAEYGGDWRETENGAAIEFEGGKRVFPLEAVAEQFRNGAANSILDFYRKIPKL